MRRYATTTIYSNLLLLYLSLSIYIYTIYYILYIILLLLLFCFTLQIPAQCTLIGLQIDATHRTARAHTSSPLMPKAQSVQTKILHSQFWIVSTNCPDYHHTWKGHRLSTAWHRVHASFPDNYDAYNKLGIDKGDSCELICLCCVVLAWACACKCLCVFALVQRCASDPNQLCSTTL